MSQGFAKISELSFGAKTFFNDHMMTFCYLYSKFEGAGLKIKAVVFPLCSDIIYVLNTEWQDI